MTDPDSLYRELRPEIEELSEPLFSASQVLVRKRGAFLPHGAMRTTSGDVQLIMATPDNLDQDVVSSSEMLPNLHEALRQAAREQASAVAVCEDVRITQEGQKETRAIKVLIEHRRGFCVALYLPFRRKLFGYSFGDIFVIPANPEVNAWPQTGNASSE